MPLFKLVFLLYFQRNNDDVTHLLAGSIDNGAKKVNFLFDYVKYTVTSVAWKKIGGIHATNMGQIINTIFC